MTAKNSNLITKKDLKSIFFRSFPLEWSWNYVKQQNLGFFYAIAPTLDKIYKAEEDRKEAYKRHLEFFNITPWLSTFPMGITVAMEESRAKDKNFDTSSINNIKVALMGPLSGIGDSFFWGTLRIIATGIGTSLALQGNILGPILFLLIFNIPAMAIRYFGVMWGYKLGEQFIDKVQESGLMSKLTYGASIVGLTVIGGMAATLVNLDIPIKLGNAEDALTVTGVANQIMPNLLPLIAVLLTYGLVKKKVKPQWIILIIAIVGIIGAYFGILA